MLSEDSKKRRELEQQIHDIAVRDSTRKVTQNERIEKLRQTATGAPVLLNNDTLFYIYTRLGSFDATARAGAVSNRIKQLYVNEFYNPDTLKVASGDNGYDLTYNNEQVILTVSETDALYFNKTPEQLSNEYLLQIKQTLREQKKANSLVNWVKRVGFVTIAIVGILLVIFIINRFFRFFSRKCIVNKKKYFKGIHFKNFTLFTPLRHLKFSLRVLFVVRVLTVMLALYLSLPILFSIFPQTEAYTYTLLNWIINPAKSIVNSVVHYLPNLFTVVVIYLFTRYTIRGVKYLANEVDSGNLHINGFYSDWAQPTFNIIKFLLYAFMLVIVFPYLPGSSSPAFQGVSVFLGILFSLGSSSAIGNIVAGLVITYMRPFKKGDRIKIGEITGDVIEKTMLVTRIRTIKNEEITLPNATVLSTHTINYTTGAQHSGIIIHSTVTLGYDVAWKKVHEVLIQAALRTDLVLHAPQPFVLQTALQDFYVSYQINAYTKHPENQAKIYSDLHQNIQDCCNENGIEILSPHYRGMRDGNMTTIPEDYLPAGYVAPLFKVASNEDEKNGKK